MCKGQCVKCKLFPEDRFNMKYYMGYFKFDRNFFLSRKSLVYYVQLMAMCLANTKYFSILRVFGYYSSDSYVLYDAVAKYSFS